MSPPGATQLGAREARTPALPVCGALLRLQVTAVDNLSGEVIGLAITDVNGDYLMVLLES